MHIRSGLYRASLTAEELLQGTGNPHAFSTTSSSEHMQHRTASLERFISEAAAPLNPDNCANKSSSHHSISKQELAQSIG